MHTRTALILFLLLTPPAFAQAPPADGQTLAAQVAAAAGSPYAVEAISFTFVVTEGGVEKARRRHMWCARDRKVEVVVDGQSTRFDLNALGGESKRAHAWFVNDGYWLFAPSKVMDTGVHHAVVDDRLELTFDEVGLTSKDRYLLEVDPNTSLVDRWSFKLEGGREGVYRWLDYRKVGPLTLATLRRNESGREIRFLDLKVHDRCPI